ncbi:hypothetical protein [Nocardia sp. BMG51109]|uniref:hypothetical protein n=1 Tax=Nocardia sp. BMG51109 TaxID=1056816 RepID=UPI0004BAEA81|nr:hypothetical protein [Nocardia sp. BMG51109]
MRPGTDKVDFLVDGAAVGSFGDPPHGKGVNLLGKPVPLLGQAWLDSSYWFPLPIPEYDERGQQLTMTRYRQSPNEPAPLTRRPRRRTRIPRPALPLPARTRR